MKEVTGLAQYWRNDGKGISQMPIETDSLEEFFNEASKFIGSYKKYQLTLFSKEAHPIMLQIQRATTKDRDGTHE